MQLKVTFVGGGSLTGERTLGARVRMGRRPDNDLAYDADQDRKVSGHHAEAWIEAGRVLVRDVGSQNGTYVNGARIAGPTAIGPSDVVRLGETGPELRLALAGVSAPPGHATPPPGHATPGKGIGEATLLRAIDQAQTRERRRGRRAFAVVGVVGLLAAGVATLVYLERERVLKEDPDAARGDLAAAQRRADALKSELDESLARAQKRHEEELAELKGKLGAEETHVARLISEMGERDRAMARIRERQDLSDGERRALVAATEGKVAELKRDLERTEGDLKKKLASAEASWADLAARYRGSIFLCVGQSDTSVAIGTGWVVRERGVLATNGHVAAIFDKFPRRAVIQSSTGKQMAVKSWKLHPEYNGTASSPDVALIEIDAPAPLVALPLAGDEELRRLGPGTQIGTLGFPGEFLQLYLQGNESSSEFTRAEATFKSGFVGRVMDFTYQRVPFEKGTLVQHSVSTTGGTSGSALFTADGKVVAVHNSGREITTLVKKGDKVVEARTTDPAQVNFGIRADILARFLRSSGM